MSILLRINGCQTSQKDVWQPFKSRIRLGIKILYNRENEYDKCTAFVQLQILNRI